MTVCREALSFWTGRDNAADLVLLADGTPLDLAAISRVRLELAGDTVLDSSILGFGAGQPFDPTASATHEGATVDVLRLTLGHLTIDPGRYEARLVVYDPDHPNGLVWTEALSLLVLP